MADKVLFTKSVDIVPVRKGIYKDIMADTIGFKLLVTKAVEEEVIAEDGTITKSRVRRQRKWGEDDEYDTVMRNFGMTPGKPGEEISQQLVFGFANVTVDEAGMPPLDYDGDMMDTDVLEAAAYNYVLNHGVANQEHEWGSDAGWLVESMMFTKDKMNSLGIPEGLIPESWFAGFYIPDPDVHKKVLDGTYNMFSIQGSAKRIPLD